MLAINLLSSSVRHNGAGDIEIGWWMGDRVILGRMDDKVDK